VKLQIPPRHAPRRAGAGRDRPASPDFLSRIAASVNYMWFSLERTTYVVGGESGEVGNPSTLLMTQRERTVVLVPRLRRSDPLRDRVPSPSGLG
jgi:hypothetical protein